MDVCTKIVHTILLSWRSRVLIKQTDDKSEFDEIGKKTALFYPSFAFSLNTAMPYR
jgi:hypothetical protein